MSPNTEQINKNTYGMYVYAIWQLHKITLEKLKETNQLELFQTIEMPVLEKNTEISLVKVR